MSEPTKWITITVPVGAHCVRLATVPDLESLVDRDALLRGDVEPPYWAHLWSGARALASYLTRFVPLAGARVLEIGCGLALPGVTAAVLGADVTVVDTAPAALAFASESARANGVRVTMTGVLDAIVPGGAGWTVSSNGRRWRFDDPTGQHGGIRRIDTVFISHTDFDHFSGIEAIARDTSDPDYIRRELAKELPDRRRRQWEREHGKPEGWLDR